MPDTTSTGGAGTLGRLGTIVYAVKARVILRIEAKTRAMSLPRRTRFQSRTNVLIGVLLLVSNLGVVAATIPALFSELAETAIERQIQSLRTAALVFKNHYPSLSFRIGQDGVVVDLTIPRIPEFDSHRMIDEIAQATGDTATVFQWDEKNRDFWRKTTNIIRNDGKRAVGTSLGQNGRVYPVVSQGRTYRGEATILGKDYFTEYNPIFDSDHHIIGILYVGVEREKAQASFNTIVWNTLVGTLAVCLAFTGFVIVLVNITIGRHQALLEAMATTDRLTELSNRRALDVLSDHVVKATKRRGEPLSALVFDLDRFKVVNDTHGHGFGDEVLRTVAAVCRRHIRESDTLFRWGGEEFLVLLPACGLEQAVYLAERMRAALESTVVEHGSARVSITASFGAAQWREGETLNDLIDRADKAQYAAKNAGRNRVVQYDSAIGTDT